MVRCSEIRNFSRKAVLPLSSAAKASPKSQQSIILFQKQFAFITLHTNISGTIINAPLHIDDSKIFQIEIG